MFQGAGKVTTVIEGVGAYESAYQGVFNDIHLNAWTEERWNNGETITYPALSLKESTNHQPNSFFIMDASYLRLKNAEIAYTLPVHISQKVMAQRIRISLSGQNLLQLTICVPSILIRKLQIWEPFSNTEFLILE